jgi:hypothetical protein
MIRQFARGCFVFSQAAKLQYKQQIRSFKFSKLFKIAGFASVPATLYFLNKMKNNSNKNSKEQEAEKYNQHASAFDSKLF